MNERPEFSKSMTVDDFEKYYWYRAELAAICAGLGLPSGGRKGELEERLKAWLSGKTSRLTASSKRGAKKPVRITLETKIIEEGFRFDNKAREFFAEYFGVKKFSFIKEMVDAVHKAKLEGGAGLTVASLIEIYENRGSLPKKISPVCRWNKFVHDFCACPASGDFTLKLKAAAFLWKKVRERPGSKNFNEGLLAEYEKELARFKK